LSARSATIVETNATLDRTTSRPGDSIPLKNIDGRYTADEHTLDELEAEGRVVFRYPPCSGAAVPR